MKISLLPAAKLHDSWSELFQMPIEEIVAKAAIPFYGKDTADGLTLLSQAYKFQDTEYLESASDHYFLAISYLSAGMRNINSEMLKGHIKQILEPELTKFRSAFPEYSARERFGLPGDTNLFTADMVSTEPSSSLVKYTDMLQLSPQRYYNTTSGMLKDFLKSHEGFVYSGDIAKLL